MTICIVSAVVVAAVPGCAATDAAAQQQPPRGPQEFPRTSVGSIGSIPFDLLPPGALAFGIGGAFSAVAHDAPAAEAKPAGLTILARPEISIHARDIDCDVPERARTVDNVVLSAVYRF